MKHDIDQVWWWPFVTKSGVLYTLFVGPWLTGHCQEVILAAGKCFSGLCCSGETVRQDQETGHCREVAVNGSSTVLTHTYTVNNCMICVLTYFIMIFWRVFNFQSDWCGDELEPASHSKTRMGKANWKDNLVRSNVRWITFCFFQVIEPMTR